MQTTSPLRVTVRTSLGGPNSLPIRSLTGRLLGPSEEVRTVTVPLFSTRAAAQDRSLGRIGVVRETVAARPDAPQLPSREVPLT